MLSEFKWYRKLMGGIWYHHTHFIGRYISFWSRDSETTGSTQVITEIEDYTK